MSKTRSSGPRDSVTVGVFLVLFSLVAQNIGASFAKQLFVSVGAYGVAVLRITLAALLLLAVRRPWTRPLSWQGMPILLGYGATLGLMNTLIYQAFARIPIGIAIGIEVAGPVMIGLVGARRMRDFVWLGVVVTGLALLLPLRVGHSLDPVGMTCACGAGACWALYIIFGKKVSAALGQDAVAWGMSVAALITAPLGLLFVGAPLFQPATLGIGLTVALLSSALPYSLEIKALYMLPARAFGILVSTSPAIGAVTAYIILGERLTMLQGISILCITAAAIGSVVTSRET